MTTTTLQGDNTAILPTLASASVQCIVTSPPYYGLRDYGIPPTAWPEVEYVPMAGLPPVVVPAQTCCLGIESDPLAYIGHLVHVWRMLRRVLRDDGVCWLNLGDSYCSTKGESGGFDPKQPARRFGTRPNDKPISGVKHKDLLGVPWRAAYALQADGWYLRSDVIWHKPNPMPESVTDRPTKAHEYLFLLSKSERYYYDADAVAEPTTDPEYRERGKIRPTADLMWQNSDGGNNRGGLHNQVGGRTTRNRRTVWSIATQPYSGAHFAVMPEALIEPCVKAGSAAQACEHCGAPWGRVVEKELLNTNEARPDRNAPGRAGKGHQKTRAGDSVSSTTGWRPTCQCTNAGSARSVVLDPYGGSGTVGRVADRLQRDATLIELNPAYVELQEKRIDGAQVEMFV